MIRFLAYAGGFGGTGLGGEIMEDREVVIIGAGPAGLAAAIFAKLDGWDVLVLEANWVGGQGAIAYTVVNYPGFPAGDGAVLMENMEKQVTSAPPSGVGAELRREEVLRINSEERIVTTNINDYRAKAVIIATGSNMHRLGVPGEEAFAGNGVSYSAKRDYDSFIGKKVLVIGGGNTTAKSALLAKCATSQVSMAHRRESLRAYPAMVKRLQKEGVQVFYNTELREVRGEDTVKAAVVFNNKTGEEKEVPIDWVIICTGTDPNTKLARTAGIEMADGLIKVNQQKMTNKAGVFACGEITDIHKHLISAVADGATAGMTTSEFLALERVRRGDMFEGSVNGKYADEYLAMV